MDNRQLNQVFFSYNQDSLEFVESLAIRLKGNTKLKFWFAPWHAISGEPIQEQMENALSNSDACAVFISGLGTLEGWQYEQMRTAIQTRVEDDSSYRVIPVLIPGARKPRKRDLPTFLRRFQMVEFQTEDDYDAFRHLVAGILGISPIYLDSYVDAKTEQMSITPPISGKFEGGHALVIAVANYPTVHPLPDMILNDALGICRVLKDRSGYPDGNVVQLIDAQANNSNIRIAFRELKNCVKQQDTVIVYFSGHGVNSSTNGEKKQYLLPYNTQIDQLESTAISGEEFTNLLRAIKCDRLLVLLDCCHSGGIGDPKTLSFPSLKNGLDEDYLQLLAKGRGRVVIASSRPDEYSWVLNGMNNSLFTHYLLEALNGDGPNLGDGFVRVFDIFRHIAEHVHTKAPQHPMFKASDMEADFPVALIVP